MNIPNFKDILQKLSVFKNNLPLLLSVIIVLIGGIFFATTLLMGRKLKAEIQKNSIAIGKRVQSETENPVSSELWRIEQERQQEHAKDANEIALLAERTTQRELLSYDIFLNRKISSTLVFREFGQKYRKAIDELIIRANAGDCPTKEKIEQVVEKSAVNSRLRQGRYYRGMGIPSMPSGGVQDPRVYPDPGGFQDPRAYQDLRAYQDPRGFPGSIGPWGPSGRMGELERMIVDDFCRETAKSISVYVNPAYLSGYEFWADYKLAVDPNKAIEDCWYFQLAYWVIEDIFDTISSMNSDYDSVLTAPVKRLMPMSFTMGLRRPGARGNVFSGFRRRNQSRTDKDKADKPMYVLSVDDGLTISCTGRLSDDDIDVIHFNFAVVINIKEVLPFMQELCSAKEHKFRGFSGTEQEQTFKHNQITVLETKFKSIEDQPYSLYDYGEDPVVELDLICEYIFNKKGYEEIKPETVKEAMLKAAEEAEANSTNLLMR